jgi:hypothetical protein
MIREDQAIGVDDEAGAGAAAWPLRISFAGTIEQLGAIGDRQAAEPAAARRPARRRVDVDDRGVQLLGDIRKRDERGGRGRRRRAPGSAARWAQRRRLGVIRPGDDEPMRTRWSPAGAHDKAMTIEPLGHRSHYRARVLDQLQKSAHQREFPRSGLSALLPARSRR